jgi:hypothetical protein
MQVQNNEYSDVIWLSSLACELSCGNCIHIVHGITTFPWFSHYMDSDRHTRKKRGIPCPSGNYKSHELYLLFYAGLAKNMFSYYCKHMSLVYFDYAFIQTPTQLEILLRSQGARWMTYRDVARYLTASYCQEDSLPFTLPFVLYLFQFWLSEI